MKKDNEIIELKPIDIKYAKITIEGDGDLVLNKMNNRTVRTLTTERENKKLTREVPNVWEDVITAIHWKNDISQFDSTKFTEKDYHTFLKENAPCLTAFGLKKAFMQAVVRNEIDTYSTKFDNAVNVVADMGLVPIKFAEASIDEKLMSPKKGAPVLVHLNHFSGWSAEINIAYTENVYSLEQIINIINLAGFGIGIGSGRSSGFGRFHVKGMGA